MVGFAREIELIPSKYVNIMEHAKEMLFSQFFFHEIKETSFQKWMLKSISFKLIFMPNT